MSVPLLAKEGTQLVIAEGEIRHRQSVLVEHLDEALRAASVLDVGLSIGRRGSDIGIELVVNGHVDRPGVLSESTGSRCQAQAQSEVSARFHDSDPPGSAGRVARVCVGVRTDSTR